MFGRGSFYISHITQCHAFIMGIVCLLTNQDGLSVRKVQVCDCYVLIDVGEYEILQRVLVGRTGEETRAHFHRAAWAKKWANERNERMPVTHCTCMWHDILAGNPVPASINILCLAKVVVLKQLHENGPRVLSREKKNDMDTKWIQECLRRHSE